MRERPDQRQEPISPEPRRTPPPRPAMHPGRLDRATILGLQATAGNASVSAMIARQEQGETATATGFETWTRDEARAIQRELRRLRLYSKGIDGRIGPFSQQGLVEAFGGDEWRTMSARDTLDRLIGAVRPRGGRGHDLRYGELFKDGVLDITLGLGYLEEMPGLGPLLAEFETAFAERGYAEDAQRAAELMAAAGRDLGESPFGRFFVLENALTYAPPAGEARPIHVVVRLVANTTGAQGAESAEAFREGMAAGDATYYTGHGRYGTGPDFDRNFGRFTLTRDDGSTQVFDDYDVLRRELRREGDPWRVFLRRVENGTLSVDLSNAGNLRLNARNLHPNEFGSRLINWAMERSGTAAETGASGAMAGRAAAHPERRYRVMVFDGCRTRDYDRAIRSTPGYSTRAADVIETNREVGFEAEVESFMAFLDGIIGQQSAEEIIRGMNTEMREHETDYEGAPFRGSGIGDNPSR